jgi:hypothetical protein
MIASMDPGGRYAMMLPERLEAWRESGYGQNSTTYDYSTGDFITFARELYQAAKEGITYLSEGDVNQAYNLWSSLLFGEGFALKYGYDGKLSIETFQFGVGDGGYEKKELDGSVFISSEEINSNKKGELSPSSIYSVRTANVNGWTLFNEFLDGTGPEYSLFRNDHPMNQDLDNSWIVTLARIKFVEGGEEPLIRYDVPYGLFGVICSYSLTEQVIGGARVSIIPVGLGHLYVVDNTMGKYSYHLHMDKDVPRKKGEITPKGTTYHRFVWYNK